MDGRKTDVLFSNIPCFKGTLSYLHSVSIFMRLGKHHLNMQRIELYTFFKTKIREEEAKRRRRRVSK